LDEDDVVRIRPRKRSWRWYEWHNKAATVQKTPWREPGILRANKMIRNEAFDMYYKFNDFEICLRLTEAADVTDWLRTIVRRCGNDPFRQFNFYMLRCNWVDLQHARSLVEFFRDNELIFRPITFEFTPRPIWGTGELWRDYSLKDNQSLFHMLDATSCLARCALEEAVDLGKRARRENWTEDWLDVEFGFWFDEKMSKEGAKALRDMILTRKQKAKSEAARLRFSWS
jgi:disulfide oxidoreductase YuzD